MLGNPDDSQPSVRPQEVGIGSGVRLPGSGEQLVEVTLARQAIGTPPDVGRFDRHAPG